MKSMWLLSGTHGPTHTTFYGGLISLEWVKLVHGGAFLDASSELVGVEFSRKFENEAESLRGQEDNRVSA